MKMKILCKLLDHSLTIVCPLDHEGNFTLFRCSRCGKEEIFCAYEGETLNNDEEGRKIMSLMQSDPEFSRQCHINWRFIDVEHSNSFRYDRQEEGFRKIRKEFNLSEGYRPANPLVLYRKGLWKSNSSEGQVENKNFSFDPITKHSKERISEKKGNARKKGNGSESRVNPKQDELGTLREKMKKMVQSENYEEAARIRDKISKIGKNR